MAIQVLKSDIRFKHKTQSGNVQYSTPLDFLIVDQGSTYFETWNNQIQGIVNSINNNLSTVNNFCQGYKANQKYQEGSYIYYNNQLYCCTSTIQKSTNWNNDKRYFQRTTISNQLTELFNSKLDKPTNGTVGQVLTKTQYSTVWSDFPNEDIISTAVAQAVASWMSDNLTIPENQSYILDDSLTLTTAAAQAKATGDAINSVVKVSVQQPDDNFNKIWIHDIQTGAKSVFTQEEIQNIIAPAYTIQTAYNEGEYVIYNGTMYCITADITAEENITWDDVSKKQISISEQVNNLNQQVKIIKKGEFSIDFTKYETVTCTIYSDNTVLKSGKNYISYQIPIDGYKSISITASPTANAMISFLKEPIPNDISNKTNITNYFATQETGRHVITGNTTNSFLLPDDTKYLFVTKTSSGDDYYTPTSIILKTLAEYKLSNIDTSAKAIGDVVDDLKSAFDECVELNDLTTKVTGITWTANRAVYYQGGGLNSSDNFKASGYIPVSPGATLKITVPVYASSQGTRTIYGLAFYNSEKINITDGRYQMKLATNGNTAEVITITVPDGASYLRTTWYNDSYSGYDYQDGFSILVMGRTTQQTGLYTVELGQDEINEFYGITSSGIGAMTYWGVTSYIDCYGVDTIRVKMPVLSSSLSNVVGLDFYDQTKTKLSFVAANRGDVNSAEIRTIPVPDGAYYFRCTYWKYENSLLYGGDWYCSFETAQYTKYRPYQSGYIFYSPLVNQSVNQYWETDLDTELDADMKQTTGVLLLPDSYTPTGKPTPIIMYFHGYSHYVYYDHWGDDEAFRTQKAQWAAQGFAVLDCNGARNNNKANHFTSGGSLQYSDGYHKCYEYVKQHYNVEDYCHVICASAGGIPGINYVYWYNDVKSLQMLSAWTSLRNNAYGTGQTASMVEYLGCDFTNGYDETVIDRTVGFDPTLRIMTIDGVKYLPQGKVPMKAFLGSDEQGSHIWTTLNNYVAALRNAGQSVSLRIVEGATHKNICSDEILALNTEYANFCKSV